MHATVAPSARGHLSLQQVCACATVKIVTPRTRPNVTVLAGDSFMRWPAASKLPV